jgi:formylmethanofuran dehydrogenase subunit E
MGGIASPAEEAEFHKRQAVVIEKILRMPIDELFITQEVRPEIPVKAKIFTSVQCARCGEMVAEHRARVRGGTFVCMPCAGEYGRGW